MSVFFPYLVSVLFLGCFSLCDHQVASIYTTKNETWPDLLEGTELDLPVPGMPSFIYSIYTYLSVKCFDPSSILSAVSKEKKSTCLHQSSNPSGEDPWKIIPQGS